MSSKNHNIISKAKKGIKNYKDLIYIFILLAILLALVYILFSVFVKQKNYLLFITAIGTTFGTLALAVFAFFQMIQNEKFRKKDFDNKKKAIYLIITTKINYNVTMIPSLSFFSDDPISPNFTSISNVLYNDKATLNTLEKINGGYYSLLETEAIYFTVNAVDAINASLYMFNNLIAFINNMQNRGNPINKNNCNYIDLCNKYYTAIIDSIKCISILIEEGNLELNKDIYKNLIESQIKALNNIESKIRGDDQIIKNTIKNVKIDHTGELREIESIRSNFLNYLQS